MADIFTVKCPECGSMQNTTTTARAHYFPALRRTYRYPERQTDRAAIELPDDLRAGRFQRGRVIIRSDLGEDY